MGADSFGIKIPGIRESFSGYRGGVFFKGGNAGDDQGPAEPLIVQQPFPAA
jgi:hypothetical protein